MIITGRCVLVLPPKTGATFVLSVLQKLHNRKAPDRVWGRLYNRCLRGRRDGNYEELHKHAPAHKIPIEHRNKPIGGLIRHPFDRYASQFYYGWWRKRPEHYCDVEKVRTQYPSFPDLSFEEFLRVSANEFGRLFNPLISERNGLGWYSRDVVKKYFRDPYHKFYAIDEEYIANGRWGVDMFDIAFLRTSDLNRDLFKFLREVGYPRKDLQFVRHKSKERPSGQAKARGGRTVEDIFTPDAKAFVRQRDRLLFEMFPEFRHQYSSEGREANLN